MKPYLSDRANTSRQSSSVITAPVGLPGEQTNSNWVLCQTASGTLEKSQAKLRAALTGTKCARAPAKIAAPS